MDEFRAYREVRSFVLLLIEEYGSAPLLDFFRRRTRDDEAATIAMYARDAWNIPLDTLITRWLAVVDDWDDAVSAMTSHRTNVQKP